MQAVLGPEGAGGAAGAGALGAVAAGGATFGLISTLLPLYASFVASVPSVLDSKSACLPTSVDACKAEFEVIDEASDSKFVFKSVMPCAMVKLVICAII